MARDAAATMAADMAEHGADVPTENPGAVLASVEATVAAEPEVVGG